MDSTAGAQIIRQTSSVCPECLRIVPAVVEERNGEVYLKKSCGRHGSFSLLLSRHPAYYRSLSSYYFSVMKKSFAQRDYIVHLTGACNLACPICLADAGRAEDELSIGDIGQFLRHRRGFKIDLMGAEPTLRDDLPEIIRMIRASGNIAALHTNGVMLESESYVSRLKRSGLQEVHLQFDGFDDAVYKAIRGRPLAASKTRALDNLAKFRISTDLVATIVRHVNEDQISPILEFARRHQHIKEVFFLGCRPLGRAKVNYAQACCMPDEVIDIAVEQTQGLVTRENVERFQKLYFALLSALAIRKCYYIHHYLLVRGKDRLIPVDDIVDLGGMQGILERFREMAMRDHPHAARYLGAALTLNMLRPRNARGIFGLLGYGRPLQNGFALSRLPRRGLLLGFISACDPLSFDFEIARNCGKGAVSREWGIQDCGALYNIFHDSLAGRKTP